MKRCATCIHRWYGHKPARWHCRLNTRLPIAKLPLIGTDADLKAAKGCKDWKGKA